MRIDLDMNSARKADNGGSQRIDSTGAYVGTFTKARKVTAKSGTVGIEFEFVDASEASADYLTIYTHKADGTPIYGLNHINALMACLRLRSIESGTVKVELWDSVAKQRVPTQVEGFPDLMNKPIGVVFQMEEYITNSGETRQRPVMVGFFDPHSKLMASEILDKKVKPEALEKFLGRLVPVKKANASNGYMPQNAQPASAPDMPSDDIPF